MQYILEQNLYIIVDQIILKNTIDIEKNNWNLQCRP
jgi:hypothetical protein